MRKDVLAVILGGGRGTRLYPLTGMRAKPAVPVGGKFRLIDIPISNCLHSGVRKIFVLTQFNTLSLHRHISLAYKFDGFSQGFLQILAAQQTMDNDNWYQGTADAVRKNLGPILEQNADLVVILSGDQLYRIDLEQFIRQHRDSGAEVTIAVKPLPRAETTGLGLLRLDGANRVVDFAEKPREAAVLDRLAHPPGRLDPAMPEVSHLASMGIYIFDKKVLAELLSECDSDDFGKGVIPFAITRRRVYGFLFDGYWEDIGTIRSYFEASLDFASPRPRFEFYDEQNPIFTHARFLPSVKIRDCHLDQVLLSDGSLLEDSRITRSIIGLRSVIRSGCDFSEVLMMGADAYERGSAPGAVPLGVGAHSRLRRCILDKNVRIGRQVVIDPAPGGADEEGPFHHRVDGIIVIPKGMTIPDGTHIF